jgi:hypothetical protein
MPNSEDRLIIYKAPHQLYNFNSPRSENIFESFKYDFLRE